MASKVNILAIVSVLGLAVGTWLLLRHDTPDAVPVAPEPIVDPLPNEALIFQTLARSATGDRGLKDGDRLNPGEALHFRVRTTRPGHLLITRIDRLGGAHLVYPANRGGQAIPVQPSETPRDLGQSLDRLAGEEHLVAFLCARPFVFDSVRGKLRSDRLTEALMPGCAQSARRLRGE